jgi:hypothetical protein
MKLKDYLLPEIEREIDRSRRALEQVPADKYDWKPHEKSMAFGYLVNMVAPFPPGSHFRSIRMSWILPLLTVGTCSKSVWRRATSC